MERSILYQISLREISGRHISMNRGYVVRGVRVDVVCSGNPATPDVKLVMYQEALIVRLP